MILRRRWRYFSSHGKNSLKYILLFGKIHSLNFFKTTLYTVATSYSSYTRSVGKYTVDKYIFATADVGTL